MAMEHVMSVKTIGIHVKTILFRWAQFMSYIALLCMSRKYVQLLSFACCTIGNYVTLSSELSNSVKT